MKLRSIETTPSPNCMKLNLDASVVTKPITINQGDEKQKVATDPKVPSFVPELLAIAGIKSVFLMDDFITITRKGNVDWQPILTAAGNVLGLSDQVDPSLTQSIKGSAEDNTNGSSSPVLSSGQDFGQVEVAVQMFREIPVQVRATAGSGEQVRVSLPERFSNALKRAIFATGADYVMERRWAPYQPQFGSPGEIAQQVADELGILISDQDLAQIEQRSIEADTGNDLQTPRQSQSELLKELQQSDWKRRLKAVQQIEVDDDTFDTIVSLLKDEKVSIRRWAAALLGSSECAAAIPPLCEMLLGDKSPMVRRTAGDALSDLGDPQGSEVMITALQDDSSLVRWRASRFLNELGDESAVTPLMQAVKTETEFDVRVEMQAAIERIESGGEVQLPMWMRISQGSDTNV